MHQPLATDSMFHQSLAHLWRRACAQSFTQFDLTTRQFLLAFFHCSAEKEHDLPQQEQLVVGSVENPETLVEQHVV